MTEEKPLPPNFDISGIKILIPFLEKFRIYQEFFCGGNLWSKNKESMWKHEKAILQWAHSKKHQHLGSNLTTDSFKNIYGLREGRMHDFLSKNATTLCQEMKQCNGRLIKHIMGNLVVKGFADVITRYGDVRETDEARDDSKYVIHSIVINKMGLLCGEVALEEERICGLWKYKIFKLFSITLFLIIISGFLPDSVKQFFSTENFYLLARNILGYDVIITILLLLLTSVGFVYLWRKNL